MFPDFNSKVSLSGQQGPRVWRGMIRAEARGGNPEDITKAIQLYLPEKLVFAEGDSWFDKFTPIPATGTNLLSAIRTPYLTVVADVSHIGDETEDMVRGQQARQTRAIFNLHKFDAILLSAGGNDLKNLFTEYFEQNAAARGTGAWSADEVADLANPAKYGAALEQVASNIRSFISMRDHGKKTGNPRTPLFLHTYDYFQPRPAGAMIFAASRIGRGPWLYPAMKAAGLAPVQMRMAADAVIDRLTEYLKLIADANESVYLMDQRGLLTPAKATSTGPDGDWMDEIHPNERGFAKLAHERWEVPLAQALGWTPQDNDLIAAADPTNPSTSRPA